MRTKTTKGVAHANFTLFVEFKPEYQRSNPATGEVYTAWTYRDDKENEKLFTRLEKKFDNAADALARVYNNNAHKFTIATLYNNTIEGNKRIAQWENGKLIYPGAPDRRKACNDWLKKVKSML